MILVSYVKVLNKRVSIPSEKCSSPKMYSFFVDCPADPSVRSSSVALKTISFSFLPTIYHNVYIFSQCLTFFYISVYEITTNSLPQVRCLSFPGRLPEVYTISLYFTERLCQSCRSSSACSFQLSLDLLCNQTQFSAILSHKITTPVVGRLAPREAAVDAARQKT